MKKTWLLLCILLLIVVIAASCSPAATSTPQTTVQGTVTNPGTPTTAAPVTTSTKPTITPTTAAGSPKYGGELKVIRGSDIVIWDAAFQPTSVKDCARLANETLADPDWTRGPAGTNEQDWALTQLGLSDYCTGTLGTSWEFAGPGKIIVNLRQGVYWANNGSDASKLVNGRQMTADDVVSALNYYLQAKNGFMSVREPILTKGTTVTKTGTWQITINYPTDKSSVAWKFLVMTQSPIVAPEVIAKYGNESDWRNVVGTGAFMVMDFVRASSARLDKNPNYWQKDPIGPGKGNQLPYIDRITYLIVPDVSTQMAAMRTGKADWITDVQFTDASSLMKSNPELSSLKFINQANHDIFMRTDLATLPFSKLKVRNALQMALDVQSLKTQYYSGQAEALIWPQVPAKPGGAPYVPLDQMPANVQNLYKYQPDAAKQMLADAGYPNGFDTKLVVLNTPEQIDLASAVKAMWEKVGVRVSIDVRELAVWNGFVGNRNYDQMLMGQGSGFDAWTDLAQVVGVGNNYSLINDPEVDKVAAAIAPIILTDQKTVISKVNDLWKYVVGQSYVIQTPEPYKYTFWRPWLLNYHGERGVLTSVDCGWAKYIWLDLNARKAYTGN